MKLSELMNKGIDMVPQKCQGSYLSFDEGTACATCALGAMVIAEDPSFMIESNWDNKTGRNLAGIQSALKINVEHPITGKVDSIFQQVCLLNDGIDDAKGAPWSREAIAAWLERIGY